MMAGIAFGQKDYAVSFAALPAKMNAESRPVVIKVYTQWCSICKIQDKQIEKNAALQKLLAEKYYYLELDAESKESIIFNDTAYTYIPHGSSGGIHALAAEFCGNKNAYPCWIFLNPRYEQLTQYNGLLKI